LEACDNVRSPEAQCCEDSPDHEQKAAFAQQVVSSKSRLTKLLWGLDDMPGLSASITLGLGWQGSGEDTSSGNGSLPQVRPERPLKGPQQQQQQRLSLISLDLKLDPFRLILSPAQMLCLTAAYDAVKRTQQQQQTTSHLSHPLPTSNQLAINDEQSQSLSMRAGPLPGTSTTGEGSSRPLMLGRQQQRRPPHSFHDYLDLPPPATHGNKDMKAADPGHHSNAASYNAQGLHQPRHVHHSSQPPPNQQNHPGSSCWRGNPSGPLPAEDYSGDNYWGSKSIVEELLLPVCKKLILDSMEPCAVRSLSLAGILPLLADQLLV
jgi:hypothetical protein